MGVPDFRSELVRAVADGDTVWSEWHWQGMQSGGTPLDMLGVFVCGVREGRMAWARLYWSQLSRRARGLSPPSDA
jgi:hypothetical protein